MRTRCLTWTLAVLLTLPLALGGCGEDDNPTSTDHEIYYRYEEIDDLMPAFAEIYGTSYLYGLSDLLHPDFVLDPRAATADTWDWENDRVLDLDDYLEIHENIYDGYGGTDAADFTLQPIANVVVDKMDQLGDWEQIDDQDAVFGGIDGYTATFDCQITFFNPDLYHFYLVRQSMEFFVQLRRYDGDEFWQIVGIRCPDDAEIHGDRSYDDLLACYF